MMKHIIAIYVKTIWGSLGEKCNMYTHILHFREMQMLMILFFWGCTLEVCLVILMQYKSICENLTNMFLLHQICIHLQRHLPICGIVEI